MQNDDYILRSNAVFAFCGACEGTEICGQMGEPCDEVKRINAIHAADVEPKRRWIPVTERLPENYGEYLVTTEGGDPPGRYVTIWIYLAWCGKWADGDDDFVVNPDEDGVVTHWMEIPEPPKEDSDAE